MERLRLSEVKPSRPHMPSRHTHTDIFNFIFTIFRNVATKYESIRITHHNRHSNAQTHNHYKGGKVLCKVTCKISSKIIIIIIIIVLLVLVLLLLVLLVLLLIVFLLLVFYYYY